VAAAFLCAWYFDTMSRGLRWFDTGEFALVGAQMGLGHPPGQPLYTMVLGLASRLPLVDPLVAMNAVSALAAGLCAVPVDGLIRRATPASPWLRCTALFAVGILFPLWDQGTRIELYAPATLLSLWAVYRGAIIIDAEDLTPKSWLWVGVILGLLAGFNIIFAIGAGLAIAAQATLSLGRGQLQRLACPVGATLLGGLLGSFHYLYLFWVRGQDDRMVWGELDTSAGILAYLTGSDYGHTAHAAIASAPGNLWTWLCWFGDEGGWVILLVGVAGFHGSEWLRRRIFLWMAPLLTGVFFTFTYGVFLPEVPDYSGYLAPALWWLAPGAAALMNKSFSHRATMAMFAVLVWGLFTGPATLGKARANDTLSRSLSTAWLESIPKGGILLVESDHLVFPMMYLQEVEGIREDVILINAGFAASSWYWKHLYRRHPGLSAAQLRAPDTGARLRHFILANQDRVVRVESMALAGAVGIRPCPDTWGFTIGPACAGITDQPKIFSKTMSDWWSGPSGREPMSSRVLCWSAYNRAIGQWSLGDATGALRTLASGLPDWVAWSGLPTPDGLVVEPGRTLPTAEIVLIGSPDSNLRLGAAMLESLGHSDASVWRDLIW
jgi:hypothetical protein